MEHHILHDNLKNEVISKTLAYMVDFKEHDNLVVIPKAYYIEISNAEICIAVVLFSGFEKDEYEALLTKVNFHIVSFNTIFQTMFEFENMSIKYFDSMALFFMALARTNDSNLFEFLRLKNINVNKGKTYLRNDVVWNYDLFTLLYKTTKTNENRKKTRNQFSSSMVLESFPAAFTENNLKSINTSYINEFVKQGMFLDNKELASRISNKKPIFVGFGVASGQNRAKKAVELALSNLNLYGVIINNVKKILLIMSADSIKIGIDEIGEINDIIQEKISTNTGIINTVSMNSNLSQFLSVTIMVSEFKI